MTDVKPAVFGPYVRGMNTADLVFYFVCGVAVGYVLCLLVTGN